jgi:hypothetical protein
VETGLFYSLNISIIFQFYYCFKFQIPQVVFRAPFSFRFVPYILSLPLRIIDKHFQMSKCLHWTMLLSLPGQRRSRKPH